jgi:hypothetical protein
LALELRGVEDGRSTEEIRGEEEKERMVGGEKDELELLRAELSVRIRRDELEADPGDSLLARGVIDALFRLEGTAGAELVLRLLLRLPEEIRDPETEERVQESVRSFRPKVLPETRGERSVVDTP